MVASEHPEEIVGRQHLLATYILYPEESTENGYIDDDGADLYEEDESGLGEVSVKTGATEVGTKEVE